VTTPAPSQGVGGLIGNLLGGAAGSLGGTNQLQQSLDTLTQAVNNLTSQVSSGAFGGGTLGPSTRQQGPTGTQPFPRMQNAFQPPGGMGGAGNISPSNSFGSFANRSAFGIMSSAVTQFGQNQMSPLLTLNQYATTSQLGINGRSQQQALQMLYRQVGATPGSLNTIAFGAQDAIGMAAPLQQLGGTMNIMASNLGRAGFQTSAAFGITNPTLGATASAQLAQALYSPQFSQTMLSLGYNPIRSMKPGGAPLGPGQAAQSILQGLGLSRMKPANLMGNLSSGRGQAALSALFGPSGISNTNAATFLEGYNQLFSQGVSATKANQLFTQAMSGNISQAKAAQAQLNRLGVKTSANDIAALKNSQAVVTGRESTYAGGFNNAIQDSTGLLEKFNTALTNILQTTGLGGAMGYGGGFSGVMAGTSHGVGMGMGIGGTMMLGRFLGLGGAGAAGGSLGGLATKGAAGLGTTLRGLGGGSATAGLTAIGTAIGSAAGLAMVDAFTKNLGKDFGGGVWSKLGLNSGQRNSFLGGGIATGLKNMASQIPILGPALSFLMGGHKASTGGGAAGAPAPSTSQSATGGNNMQGGISGAAKHAVSAAESQLGVPYAWGDEIPGVGFDCSGLVQWAYKQAGINLPRTSQSMWSDLKKRRVPLNSVQEGDLVFTAGSDGSATSPGHVGMMVSGNRLIQAPSQGKNVQIIGYDPNGWTYAARPAGSGSFIAGSVAAAPGMAGTSPSSGLVGNRCLSSGPGTNQYGSANEVDLIAAMGAAGGRGSSLVSSSGNGTSGSGNKNTGGGSVGSASYPRGASSIVAMAKKVMAGYGWGSGMQWNDYLRLMSREDGSWDVHATNPKSGAYGLPQALPGSKMASAGADWMNNPMTQLMWQRGYIKNRYGSPAGAWAHEQAYNWYGQGGMVQPGLSIVGDRGPELMMTSGGRSQIFSNSQTMALINSIKGNVPQNPWKTDVTSGSSSSGSYQQKPVTINFNQGSIVIHSNNSEPVASKAGREVARQVVNHLSSEAVSQAIRNGEKL
jgi:cell wall-associated NlpC family hydrolase